MHKPTIDPGHILRPNGSSYQPLQLYLNHRRALGVGSTQAEAWPWVGLQSANQSCQRVVNVKVTTLFR